MASCRAHAAAGRIGSRAASLIQLTQRGRIRLAHVAILDRREQPLDLRRDRRALIGIAQVEARGEVAPDDVDQRHRSEEHTSELQSLMRLSYAVFCLNNTRHY